MMSSIISTGIVGQIIYWLLKVFGNVFDSVFMTSLEKRIKSVIVFLCILIVFAVIFMGGLVLFTAVYSTCAIV